MGNRRDDHPSSRTGYSHDPGRGGGPARGVPGRAYDRDEDMGGSGWSGSSGRGGMSYEGSGHVIGDRGYGYGREGGYPREHDVGHEHGHEGGYPGDRRHPHDEASDRYPQDRRFGHQRGYPAEPMHAGHADEGGYAHRHGTDDAGFIEERGFGHVPGQRWSGGYGGDRDRAPQGTGPSRDFTGRGFTGNDFGGPPRQRMAPPGEDRGPHWGKGPKGYKRSDERTREEVCEAIAHQGHIDASDVEVRVDSGIVILTGTVAQRHHKRALEQLVERCRGVHDVHNELRLGSNQPRREPSKAHDDRDGTPIVRDQSQDQGNGNPKNGKSARG